MCIRDSHKRALIHDITIISGRTFSANIYGCASNNEPKRKLVPSAVAEDNFATPLLKASKKLFTKSFNKMKAKTNIIKIAKKIFFTFICLHASKILKKPTIFLIYIF